MRYSFTVLFFLFCFSGIAQQKNEEAPITVSAFTAQFLLSTDLKAAYFNMVGAGIKYSKNDKSISITIFPSLSFREDKYPEPGEDKKPFVRPGFAVGPLIQYKRMMIGFPAFYQDDAWHFTVGAGVKLGR